MSNLTLHDKLAVSDSKKTIRGFVSMFDNIKNRFIFQNKENLVMNSGREFVKQLFVLNSGIIGATNDVKFTTPLVPKFRLSACVFGTDSNASRADMEYVPDNYALDYTILATSPDFSVSFADDMVLQITISLNGLSTSQTMISNLALVLTTGEEDGDVMNLLRSGDNSNTALFSRLVFDPIPVGAGTNQTITYYIYF